MASLPDTLPDKRIKVCIRSHRSFSVVAGAGSGKTSSLIKSLEYVRDTQSRKLHRSNKRVACITFTNRAVEVIKARLNSDELFFVTTLHGFLWGEIKNFQNDIRDALKNYLIPLRIAKKQEDDDGGKSKAALAARKKVERLKEDLIQVSNVAEFSYSESGNSNYSKGDLDHDDVVDLASLMITHLPILRKVIGQRYPYIFVDEAQDTFPNVVEALNLISENPGLPIVGYFGDPMQQIYEKRAGSFSAPTGSPVIKKIQNYRCSVEVINLLNSFRVDIKQIPAGKNKAGSVEIRLLKSEEGLGPRKSYTSEQIDRCLVKFDQAMSYFGWKDNSEVKRLFLARQMIARRLGFPQLNVLFTGEYSSRGSQDDFESGKHYLLVPFIKILVPSVDAINAKDSTLLFSVLRKESPLLSPSGENQKAKIKDVIAKVETAMTGLLKIWDTKNLKEILNFSIEHRLIQPSERLIQQLSREKRAEIYDEETHGKDKGDWLADEFFSLMTSELRPYIKFVQDETPFSTQHGVKGEEYKKVLVCYDDTEAAWNNYSFSKLLTPAASGKEPTEGQKTRSQKLAYVSFSRAEEDLRIILFTPNPETAKKELLDQKLFTENQISIQE